ncbi:MAG: branched-chain amino acid ABC transporter permease [Clostridia bacterium]|nr:branched-chain amino acid ABC transporter permease [Clostridia bacterium]
MTITTDTILTIAAVIGALGVIFGVIFAVYRWYLKQNKQDEDIKSMKDEQCLLTYGVLACLKGLAEQGCDGPVKEAINKIEKHMNQQAHK